MNRRIGVDISICAFNNAGNARYSRALVSSLQQEALSRELVIVPLELPLTLQATAAGLKRKALVAFWETVYAPVLLALICRQQKCDLLHITAPTPIAHVACPVVTTVHDVIPVLYGQWFPKIMGMRLRRWTKRAALSSTHIITDSESTAADLRHVLPCLNTPISVIYPGSFINPAQPFRTSVSALAPTCAEPYILSVGTLEPRKNLQIVLEAYQILTNHMQDVPKLVVVGAQGWMAQDIEHAAQRLAIQSKLELTGFIDDAQLIQLYKHARFLIYPSLYEGFGFPVLEAMSAGCPVITSNASSLPEVVNQAGLLVNPTDVKQVATAMRVMLQNPALAAALRVQGYRQAQHFSWSRCAQETISVYNRVLGT